MPSLIALLSDPPLFFVSVKLAHQWRALYGDLRSNLKDTSWSWKKNFDSWKSEKKEEIWTWIQNVHCLYRVERVEYVLNIFPHDKNICKAKFFSILFPSMLLASSLLLLASCGLLTKLLWLLPPTVDQENSVTRWQHESTRECVS